jgi:hypothetical protein
MSAIRTGLSLLTEDLQRSARSLPDQAHRRPFGKRMSLLVGRGLISAQPKADRSELDEWAVQRARYLTLEAIAPLSDNTIASLPAVAR